MQSTSASSMSENSQRIKIDAGGWVHAVRFTTNGEHLVSGGDEGIRVWRVKSAEQVATRLQVKHVYCVAVSKDGRYIAAGSYRDGEVSVWDATSYKQVFAVKVGKWAIRDIDFSPDSTRLVTANGDYTATIWSTANFKKPRTIDHGESVRAAKYSPRGDRIATAAQKSIRIWASDDGRLLMDIKVGLSPWRGLIWASNYLFVIAEDSKIKKINATTGSTVSEWTVPRTDHWSSIALPEHEKFIAYSTTENITLWDTFTHAQLALIPRSSERCPIAFSPDDELLAVVAQEQKIFLRALSLIKEPDIRIEKAALGAWKHGQLVEAEALLSSAILASKDSAHHVLASRAVVRARLRQWDAALADAEESIKIRSSVVAHIAKCMIFIGKGDTRAGYRMCDIAFQLHPNYVTALLVVKAVILFVGGEYSDALSRIDDLISTAYFDPTFYVVQAYMHLFLGNLHMDAGDYERAIQSFEDARLKLGNRTSSPPLLISLISGWKFEDLAVAIQKRLCEALLSAGRSTEAGEMVLRMVDREIKMSEPFKIWVSEFTQRCLSTFEPCDHASLATADHNIVPHPITPLLRVWAKLKLATGMWKDALTTATTFTLPRSKIYQFICEHLEMTDRVVDAVSCFHQMYNELAQEIEGEESSWTQDLKSRCCKKLENLGDSLLDGGQYDDAISQYTVALSLSPTILRDLLDGRSKAYAGKKEWEAALSDANELLKLYPSSPLGYERKHAALHGMGCFDYARRVFDALLVMMSQSTNPESREQSSHYIRPEQTQEMIRTTIEDSIRDSPLVLINTNSGRLCNRTQQAFAFRTTLTYTELISAMTTRIDNVRVEQEVEKYYRYATLSHKWEADEPLFEKVIGIVVYDLEASPTHEKLQMFCKIVREAGFNWAWSDTCCINKGDHFVLQEALVSMFKWYERSAMTIIFLRGVGRFALRGALTRSIWNRRAWTLQEYHASKVVQIYTEDWTPYLGLDLYNHKDSPEITSEMEEATGISAQALMALRPGLDNILEKLHLASTRQTTRVEDAAYSLLGIFSMSLPILYGEGDLALGKLLAQLLTSSGEMSILAWTGRSGSFNSCLPASIAVFSQLPTSHIPLAVPDVKMETIIAESRRFDLTLAIRLYDQLQRLPVPLVTGQRIKLPCLAFELGRVVLFSQEGSTCVFRARANVLGIVEIRTEENLSQCSSLHLVHPWINFLLDRQPFPDSSVTHTVPSSPLPPVRVSFSEKETRVLQFIARLKQPFGALLLVQTRQNIEEYRRIATKSLITVRVEEITQGVMDKLIQDVRVLDVL